MVPLMVRTTGAMDHSRGGGTMICYVIVSPMWRAMLRRRITRNRRVSKTVKTGARQPMNHSQVRWRERYFLSLRNK